LSVHQFKHFAKGGNGVTAPVLQGDPAQICASMLANGAGFSGHAAQIVVVKHHCLIVPAQLQVNLDSEPGLDRRANGGAAVFGPALGDVMQRPMRNGNFYKSIG